MTKLDYVPEAFLEVVHSRIINLHKFNQEEEELRDHAHRVQNQEDCLVSHEDWNEEWRVEEEQIDVKDLFDTFLSCVELVVNDAHDGGLLEESGIADHLRDDVAQRKVVEQVVFLAALVHQLQLLAHDQVSEVDVSVFNVV